MSTTTEPQSEDTGPSTPTPLAGYRRWLRFVVGANNLYIFLVLLGLIALFSLISPGHAFWGADNFKNIAWDSSETLLLAIGETFVIITAGIDLSVGTVLMLSGISASWVMAQTGGSPQQVANQIFPHAGLAVTLGIIAGIGMGLCFGMLNGLLVTRLRLPSFIVTLGIYSVAYGFGELIFSNGAAGQNTIPVAPGAFTNSFGSDSMISIDGFGLPTLVIAAAVAALVAHVILSRTIFGRRTFAVGSNLEGSRLAGVPVNLHVWMVYALCGGMSGLAGVFDLARYQTVDVSSHATDNLNAIAAVVIGGTSLFGGIGSILGTTIGAFIPTALRYGFTIQGVSSFWQDIAVGSIIIVAVWIDQIRRSRSS
jgi:ribose transport system permease protein